MGSGPERGIVVEIECPNCGARYQGPEEALGPKGRDVTCSSCGNVWHAVPVPEGPIDVTSIGGVQTQPPRRGAQMAEIRQMLDQVQKSDARRAAPPAYDEPETPHAASRWTDRTRMVDPPKPRADVREAVFGHARDEEDDEEVERTESFLRERTGVGGQSGRLKTTGRRGAATDGAQQRSRLMQKHARRHRKFEERKRRGTGAGLTGFTFVAIVGGLLVGLYALREPIADRLPSTAPPLANYVTAVDGLRAGLSERFAEIRTLIEERTTGASDEG